MEIHDEMATIHEEPMTHRGLKEDAVWSRGLKGFYGRGVWGNEVSPQGT